MKKLFLFLLVLFFCATGFVCAKDENDFCQETYEKALKGGKDFVGAKLEGANFKGINLSGADFRGAELDEVNFEGANLTNVNFTNADLDDANLKGANIKGAIFKGAELEYAKWVDGRICGEGSIGGCW